jgi:hypothetical protein
LLSTFTRVGQAKWISSWSPRYFIFHLDVKKAVWWNEDFKETLGKVHRQANNNSSTDFTDSELILQDFINRYVDPNDSSPLRRFNKVFWFISLQHQFAYWLKTLFKWNYERYQMTRGWGLEEIEYFTLPIE